MRSIGFHRFILLRFANFVFRFSLVFDDYARTHILAM